MTTRLGYPDPPLTDGSVLLRRWAESDVACVQEASSDPRIPEGTTVPAVYTPEEGLGWIKRQWGRSDNGEGISLAVVDADTNEAVGALVLMFRQHPGTVGLGYWVIPRARRRRFASEVVTLAVRWALTDAGLDRVEALVEPSNDASIRVLEAAGFQREGLLRSYLVVGDRRADAFMYSIIARDLP